VSGQLHAPAALPPGERAPGTQWIGGRVDLRAGLDDLEKRTFLTLPGLELRPPVVQPVASRYTNYAIPAPLSMSTVPNYTLVYAPTCCRTFIVLCHSSHVSCTVLRLWNKT
jgi:hypothetical protein